MKAGYFLDPSDKVWGIMLASGSDYIIQIKSQYNWIKRGHSVSSVSSWFSSGSNVLEGDFKCNLLFILFLLYNNMCS